MCAQRSAFERRERLAPVGLREWRLWRWRLRWGGAWYLLAPLSLLRMRQVLELTDLPDPGKVREPSAMIPAHVLRALVPQLVNGSVDARHLARASPQQLADLYASFWDVNDGSSVLDGFARLSRDGLTVDRLAVKLGTAFNVWPGEILHEPAQAVFAVAEELGLLGPPFHSDTPDTDATSARQVDRERIQ